MLRECAIVNLVSFRYTVADTDEAAQKSSTKKVGSGAKAC